jgi:branched-chain amino acid transport system permease protein
MTQQIEAMSLPLSKTKERLQWTAGPWAKLNPLYAGIGLVVVLVLPWILDNIQGGRFVLHLIILFFGWGIVVQCWNLIMGVSGIYSFAQVALFAIGGWTTGVLTVHYGWSPWLSIWLAPIAAVIAALIIGLPTLRLRGTYVVLLTLAFHELLRNLFTTGPRILSGGGYGLKTVPKFGFETWFGGGFDRVLYY